MPNASIPTMPARESVLTRANSLLDWLEVNFIGAALIMAAGLLFVNVVLRYVFLAPIGWAEEFSLYTIVWIVFIGGSVAIRTRGHIAIDLLMLVLPAQGRRLLLIFVGLVTLVFLAVFFYYSGLHVLRTKSSGAAGPDVARLSRHASGQRLDVPAHAPDAAEDASLRRRNAARDGPERLEHRAEKWEPVFGRSDTQTITS
jgi:C4-dicarboxylate transporter DctQ subunit